jgi:hypothetical protein
MAYVPDEVAAAYQGTRPRFGREYIIPVPFDPRLIFTIPPAGYLRTRSNTRFSVPATGSRRAESWAR